MSISGDFMQDDENDEWYDAKGNSDPDGWYDAGGHFSLERAANAVDAYHDAKKEAMAW